MIRVTKILKIDSGKIVCQLNNGTKKSIDVKPLIEKHSIFEGIEQLKNETFLKTAQIGEFGEIYWKDAVTTSSKQKWNYDISPEYINYFGESV
jgi:hypothetical protein